MPAPDVADRILFSDEKLFTIQETLRMIVSFQAPRHPGAEYQEGKSQLQSWYGAESQQTPGQILFLSRGVNINSKTNRELILDTEVKGFGCIFV